MIYLDTENIPRCSHANA